LLKIAEIVVAAGSRFAAPTRLTYLSNDTGVDADRVNDNVRRATERQASKFVPISRRKSNRNDMIAIGTYFEKRVSQALLRERSCKRKTERGNTYVYLASISHLVRDQYLGLALRTQSENQNIR
jgi:hypothetical protein